MPARIWRLSRRNPLPASLVVTTMLAVIATVIVLAVMLDRETGLRKIATSAAAEANLASAISAHAVGDIASMAIRLEEIPESDRGWVHRWLTADIDPSVMSITGFRGDVIDLSYIDDPPGDPGSWLIISDYSGLFAFDVLDGEEIWFTPWLEPSDGWRHTLIEAHDQIAAVDLHGRVRVFELETGAIVSQTLLPEPIGEVSASPSGNELLAVGEQGRIYVLDVPTLELLRELDTGSRSCRTGVWLPDGRMVIGTEEGNVLVIDAMLESPETILTTDSAVIRIASAASGRLAAVGFTNGRTLLLDTADWSISQELLGSKGAIFGIAFDSDERYVHTVGTDDSIRTFEVLTGEQTMMIGSPQGYVWSVVTDTAGGHLWTGGKDGTIRMWRRSNGVLLLPGGESPVVADFEPDGPRFVVVAEDGGIHLGDADLGAWNRGWSGDEVVGVGDRATAIRWIDDDVVLVGCRSSGLWRFEPSTASIRNVVPSASIAEIVRHPDHGAIVGFRDGRLSHVGSDGSVLRTTQLPPPEREHEAISIRRRMAVSLATRELAIISGFRHGKTARMDIDSWEITWSPEGSIVNYDFDIDYSPDGRRLAIVGRERPQNVVVLDLERNEYVGRIAGHLANATHVDFIAGGSRLLSAGQDGAVFISRPTDSRPIAKLLQLEHAVRWMASSTDGTCVMVLDEDGIHFVMAPNPEDAPSASPSN